MNYNRLNEDWNADPNLPDARLIVVGDTVALEFYLNSFIYPIAEGQVGRLTFVNCHKYSFNSMNDEGYYMGQYRYKHEQLPWGEFYLLDRTSENDFPMSAVVLNSNPNWNILNHYIFFLKDDTFECIAENYSFENVKP